jgi:hypothetical protein
MNQNSESNDFRFSAGLLVPMMKILFATTSAILLMSCINSSIARESVVSVENFSSINSAKMACLIKNGKLIGPGVVIDALLDSEGSTGAFPYRENSTNEIFSLVFSDSAKLQLLGHYKINNIGKLMKLSRSLSFRFYGIRVLNGTCGFRSHISEILFVDKISSFE